MNPLCERVSIQRIPLFHGNRENRWPSKVVKRDNISSSRGERTGTLTEMGMEIILVQAMMIASWLYEPRMSYGFLAVYVKVLAFLYDCMRQ